MIVSMIAAMANGRVIGKDNKMPWHLPADLQHFKRVTMGKPLIMGRKTYESIGKALPGRLNIVISRDPNYAPKDAMIVSCPDVALEAVSSHDEVMIIGGGTLYEYFLPQCDRLYLTDIDLDTDGDTLFPDYTKVRDWKEVSSESHQADDKNPHNYRFYVLEK